MNLSIRDVRDTVNRIKPILAGHDPSVQSVVLADLLATWIVGHHPDLRSSVLATHIALVGELIPYNEKEVFGNAGHPGRRDLEERPGARK